MNGSRVFDAIARGAAEATGAVSVAIVASAGDDLRVVGAAGGDRARTVGDAVAPGEESIGYVLASGQTLSLGPQADRAESARQSDRPSGAVLSVPCLGAEGVLGVVEIRGGPGVEPFPPDATRIATLLAEIAAAALQEGGGGGPQEAPAAAELGAELARLAEADPNRYSAIASVIGALLAHG